MRTAALALALALGLAAPASAYEPDRQPKPVNPGSSYELGRREVHRGDWLRAVALFRMATEENPRDFRAFTLLGYSLRHAGRLREAIAAYDRALAIRPAFAEALEYRGIAHMLSGDRAAALRDYQALVRLGSPVAEDLKKVLDGGAAR